MALSAARWLFLSRIEIEEGFFYVSGFFELAGKILYGILLLLCADSKGLFSAQQIFLLLALPPKPFVAVEPFDIFQLGVFVEQIEESVTEASGGEHCDCENNIYPLWDCSQDCAVDKIAPLTRLYMRCMTVSAAASSLS